MICRCALLQLATKGYVFVIDTIKLRGSPILARFLQDLLTSAAVTKFVYGGDDIKALSILHPSLTKLTPVNMVDLQTKWKAHQVGINDPTSRG